MGVISALCYQQVGNMRSLLLICAFSFLFSEYSCIVSRHQPTKPPHRIEIPKERVLASNPSSVSHNAPRLNSARPPLIVHPGKNKYVSSTEATPVTTEASGRKVELGRLIQIDHPIHSNGYETEGCIEAAESPSLQKQVIKTTPSPVQSAPTRFPPRIPKSKTETTAKKVSHERLSCPEPNGLFPYGKDCKKFINCWQGRAHVQDCAPGTLFNAAKKYCDHARKVKCQ